MANGFDTYYFEVTNEVKSRQWQAARDAAMQSGDPYAQALVLIDDQDRPLPDMVSEWLPALSLIISEAQKRPDEPQFSYRALASFNWRFGFGTDADCRDDVMAARVLPLVKATLGLFQGELRDNRAKLTFLDYAAKCSRGAESVAYTGEGLALADATNPEAAASASQQTASEAFEKGDFARAKDLYQKMHGIIRTRSNGAYSAQQVPGSGAGPSTIVQMYHVGLRAEVDEAAMILVRDFRAIPVEDVFDATIPGDMLREIIGDVASMLVQTRQIDALREFGSYISEGREPWYAAAFGVNDLMLDGADEEAATAAAFYAPKLVADGAYDDAARLAVQEAEAQLRLGATSLAERALSNAILWAGRANEPDTVEVDIQRLRAELSLSGSEARSIGDVWAEELSDYYSRACTTNVIGGAGTLSVEVDHVLLSTTPRLVDELLSGGVLETFEKCDPNHSVFQGVGRLYCHLAVADGKDVLVSQFLDRTLSQTGTGFNSYPLTACMEGLGDAGRRDLLFPFATRIVERSDDLLLTLAALPDASRDAMIASVMPTYVSPNRWAEPDAAVFLKAMSDAERLEKLDAFRTSYQIAHSGASMRSYELEYINNQAYATGHAWLGLGLPRVAEAYFAVDDRLPLVDLPLIDPETLRAVMSDLPRLRLVEAHARAAVMRGDVRAASSIIAPVISLAITELLADERAFPATIEQFAGRNASLFRLWLSLASDAKADPNAILLVQQGLTMAASTAHLSALDQRMASGDAETVRKYQDVRRSLRILQGRPLDQRDPGKVEELSSRLAELEDALEAELTNGSGAFGILARAETVASHLGENNAGLLVASQLNDGMLLSWTDGDGTIVQRLPWSDNTTRNKVAQFRDAILSDSAQDKEKARHLARSLYSDLLEWTRADTVTDIRLVIDGALGGLPFAALLTEDDQWLGQRYTLRVAPSVAWALDQSADDNQAEKPFLGIGAVNFSGLSDRVDLPPLPETEAEVRFLAAALGADPASDVLVSDQATEARLRTLSESGDLARFETISFATHGLLGTSASHAGLALSTPEGRSADDGLLTSEEIFQLRIDARLVILSACNTGVPGASAGLSDLSSAFLFAGAKRLLVSHWEVDSGGTIEFMRLFAINMKEEQTRELALRRTIEQMSHNGAFAHPRYWAAFFLIG
jgi:CHAT domain-containing protein